MTKRKPGSATPPRRAWSPADIQYMHDHYPHEKTELVAAALGRTTPATYGRAQKLGLSKSAEFFASTDSGRTDGGRGAGCRFVKGQQSWNKGTKGVSGNHPNTRRSQFKKGERHGAAQHNYVPLGTERIYKDGYLVRKVTDDHPVPARRWVAVHRLVWESANGPIPRGHVVCFLPGRKTIDREKITLDALELVTRKELARRNHPVTRSPELAKLVQLKSAITRQINRIAREAKEKES